MAPSLLVLFAILAIGALIGQVTLKGISLGAAGVLFTAMLFGHFKLTVPESITELGLLLFVYAVGLQAGPRFFRTFRRRGLQYAVIGGLAALSGVVATVIAASGLALSPGLASGLFAGALTCTPALAAAIDAAARLSTSASAEASVGYGVAYPFSIISMVLLIQFLPRLLRRGIPAAEQAWQAERQADDPSLEARQFLINNPNIEGHSVKEINPHRMSLANISRIKHGEQVFAATPDAVLHLGDVVMAVGQKDELDKMRMLLGEETHVRMDMNTNVLSTDVQVVEDSLVGRKLADLRVFERYNIVITRIRRQGVELTPTGAVTLEMGDTIRVVGERVAVEEFARLVHGPARRAEETNIVPFLVGLLLGVAVGSIPVSLPNGLEFRLGTAGGAFLTSLVLGHFGRIGPLRLYVPAAARNITRELGLMLFLAGAGVNAGAHFVEVIEQRGFALLGAGIFITLFTIALSLAVMHLVYRFNILSTMGALCAGMTNPPALGAANAQTSSELPTLAYASVYPVALITKIVFAQVLVQILRVILGGG